MGVLSDRLRTAGEPAARRDITITLTDADGTAVRGTHSSGMVVYQFKPQTDSAGLLSVTLPDNADITPANTGYTIDYGNGLSDLIVMTSGGGSIADLRSAPASLGATLSLDNLSDVGASSPSDGEALAWKTDEWVPSSVPEMRQPTSLHDVVSSDHSWDMAEAVTADSVGDYSEEGTRATSVPDGGTASRTLALRDDNGPWSEAMFTTPAGPIPGPRWFSEHEHFRGRAAVHADALGVDADVGFLAGRPAYSMLASTPDYLDDSSEYFEDADGYQQPWWFYALARMPADADWGNVTDSEEGGATISPDNNNPQNWGVTTDFGDPWPHHSHEVDPSETVAVIVQLDGASSWMEIAWRDQDGELQRDRDNLTLSDRVGEQGVILQRFGLLNEGWWSAVKLGVGSISDADADALVYWSALWLPPSGGAAPKLGFPVTETGTARTLVRSDEGKLIRCTSSSAATVTVPPDSDVNFPFGTQIRVRSAGTGGVTIAAGSGVTVNEPPGGATGAQGVTVMLIKVDVDEWDLVA